jgi:hypothetical protein
MIVVESRDFLFNSRHLSVRATASSEGWRIRVFVGDQVATALRLFYHSREYGRRFRSLNAPRP